MHRVKWNGCWELRDEFLRLLKKISLVKIRLEASVIVKLNRIRNRFREDLTGMKALVGTLQLRNEGSYK